MSDATRAQLHRQHAPHRHLGDMAWLKWAQGYFKKTEFFAGTGF